MVSGRTQLHVARLGDARKLFFDSLERINFFHTEEEEIPTRESLGRITSRAVLAKREVPHFRSAAMDGIALCASGTLGASEAHPVRLKLERDFVFVDTGDPIPDQFDSVVMIEKIRQDGDAAIISKEAQIGQHIRTMGEDFSLGALLLETSSEIRAEAIAALLSAGNASVWVKRFLRCLFIPTGSELVPAELKLKQGQLPETNSILFQHYVTRWGGSTSVHAIVRDHKSDLQTVLRKAIQEYDFIAIGSGTSKGRDDWTASLMQELGQVLVHGVAYHPGHPVLLGIVDGKPVIGIPGYPVAAWACLVQFVKPLLEKYYHIRRVQKTVQGILSQDIRSISGYREFVRVRLIMEGEELRVQPLPGGASRLSSLLHADGWIEIPEEAERLNKGETISVNMME